MQIKSKICDMLNIRYPVLQGGMSCISDARLVSAVGRAGGIGFIGAGGMPLDILRQEIRLARKLSGDTPFGVNLMLKDPNISAQVEVVIEERVDAVSTGAGNPEMYIKDFRNAGIKVLPVVSSCTLAMRMEAMGIDAIIAEGTESGGHVGEMTTMTLIPQIADCVSIPVVAAGGIADSRGLLAALILGADAVQVGTLFLAARECSVHPNYKNAVLSASDRSTVVTGRHINRPVRSIKNRLTRKMGRLEFHEDSRTLVADIRKGKLHASAVGGDVDSGFVMCGQVAGLIRCEKSVEDIFHTLLSPIVSEQMDFFERMAPVNA